MTIRVALNHRTEYRYDRQISLGPQWIRLRPAPHCRTPIATYSLQVTPADHFINWQQDPYGNFLARCVFPKSTDVLRVEVDLVAELTVINPFDFFLEASAEKFPFRYEDWLARELQPFLERLDAGPDFDELCRSISRAPTPTADFLVALNQRLHQEIGYVIRLEPGVQTPAETLGTRSGSCRDTAWLLVQVLRHLGLAARFASGYLIQLAPDEKPLEGPAGPAADFTDLHAWAEVFLPGAGWVGLDPTSGLLTGEGHLPLACTPDPSSAAPITGTVDACQVAFSFDMRIDRIHEDPRVTRPYRDEEWEQIQRLGQHVDERLVAGDVRLTMGGEPTFVSIDDMDGAEWNTEAVGNHKRRLSEQLIQRLRAAFAPGGLLHYGQGKWYPGESLPRWSLGCFWRPDGVPVWQDVALIADGMTPANFTIADARRFMETLARLLGLEPRWVQPAFEDVTHYLLKEQQLPVNVDPCDAKLRDPEERARLARVFARGLDQPCGYVLPLARQWPQAGPRWTSGKWPFRGARMSLLPGDSPLGLRLPLDSLPWVPTTAAGTFYPLDPGEPRPPLPPSPRFRASPVASRTVRQETPQVTHPQEPLRSYTATEVAEFKSPDVVRTALCVEERDGLIHVFMPPVERLEDYLDLVSAVEHVAAELSMPVALEGYPPPHDPRLQQIKVTPDPGVIEVNIHPAANWSDLVTMTTTLYEEARQARLGTEKFDLDGQHTGTGGGNHVVVGGRTPGDSPFLRRPDVLRSLVGYWLNHPSLSYLFSGRFVGPTSQAPRVDEGRRDALYELQLAFSLVPSRDAPSPPWLIDRLFRNLLVDVTGNTHRAEFCIDKLYSPDSASGRLGLVELRALEMPPHARMSLTQQLLIRALIAWMWESPYVQPPVDWGTALHDRFMLPHYVWQDFLQVLGELKAAGMTLEPAWFAPHFEFRFPRIGELQVQGVHLELRTAIEPWYVLGEEPAGGGTVRYVDSSVERLQVKVTAPPGDRLVVCCRGRRVPLQPTAQTGVSVAGVRYRAWQPPQCLHPTIPVHTPLVFDVLDTWSRHAVGGCRYHVAHPAGRTYETFPVNAFEAEARRASRFFAMGHTPGIVAIPPREINPDFPLTLDLRRDVTRG